MKKKGIILMLLAALGLGVSGCGKETEKTEESKTVNMAQNVKVDEDKMNTQKEDDTLNETDRERLIEGTVDFSLKLLQESIKEPGENIMISPVSIQNALAMTANGAVGNTLEQMLAVLAGANGESQDRNRLNESLKAFNEGLTDSENASLKQANSIWVKEGKERLEVKPDFLERNGYFYGADVYKAPFDASTLEAINQWVKDKTDGRIEEILDKIPNEAVMYLINAISFDAEWRNTYLEHQVREKEFTNASGNQEEVQLMYSEEGDYLEDGNACGFIKYYKEGYYFMAMLPEEGTTVEEYVNSLNADSYLALLEQKKKATVMAAIPKFTSEYTTEMSELLESLGMTDAFDANKADFSGLATLPEENIYINRVLHKTFIQVDELGTKAGAATIVEMVEETAAIEPEEIYNVYLNRPFLYAVVDGKTNVPIFIGIVNSVKEG